jgi:hypothetical protein
MSHGSAFMTAFGSNTSLHLPYTGELQVLGDGGGVSYLEFGGR